MYFNFIILGTFALALGSINEKVYLIRRFGSDRSPHQWYLLKSRKYKNDAYFIIILVNFASSQRILNVWFRIQNKILLISFLNNQTFYLHLFVEIDIKDVKYNKSSLLWTNFHKFHFMLEEFKVKFPIRN